MPPLAWSSKLGELVRHQRERIVEDLGASRRSFEVPHLERADPVESRAVAARLELVDAHRVADLGHGDEPGADIAVAVGERGRLTTGGPTRPGAGEAVGLLFGEDRRERTVEVAGAELDGVAELVGQHRADGSCAVVPCELRQESVVAVVVHEEVADAAVEGDVLTHFLVRRGRGPATGDVVGAARVGRVHAALERREVLAVDRRVLFAPPHPQVGHHAQEEVVVGLRRLVGAEVDRRRIGREC